MPILDRGFEATQVVLGHSGQLLIFAGGKAEITDATYLKFLDTCVALNRELGVPRANIALGFHVPTRRQRRWLYEYTQDGRMQRPERFALLTESALMLAFLRGCAVLFRGIGFRGFRPADHGTALDWLSKVATFDRAEAQETLRQVAVAAGYDVAIFEAGFRARFGARPQAPK